MQPLARDVLQVFLRLPAVEPLTFEPGQYIDLILEGGQRRSFSIASPPHDAAEIELHVRRVAGGAFTERLFDGMRPGALLRLEGPIGQFIYTDSGAPLVLIAGGTGFAPIKSILRHVLERVHARGVRFYWGARTAADVYEAALVRRWQAQHPRLEFIPVLSEATAHDCRCGLVTDIALREERALSQSDTYAAGPPQMIEALRAGFQQRGIAAERLRFDSFDYAPA
jgi:CDP-4-dehydro-6-deoxyglucose reductase